MRTAITRGKLRGQNKREDVFAEEIPITVQLEKFKKVQVSGVHEKYEAMELWTKDRGLVKQTKGLVTQKAKAEADAKAKADAEAKAKADTEAKAKAEADAKAKAAKAK